MVQLRTDKLKVKLGTDTGILYANFTNLILKRGKEIWNIRR